MKVYGVILTDPHAYITFLVLKEKAGLGVDIGNKRDCLREVYMGALVIRQVLIIFIRDLDRAVLGTGGTTPAFFFNNVPGFLSQGYPEVSRFPFYTVHFSKGKNLYVYLPADLDQFGGEYSHGAVVGRIGLVELGHVAADGRRVLNQVDLETRFSQIKGGLDTADAATDNHNIADIALLETAKKIF
jgi:hypothetical protein